MSFFILVDLTILPRFSSISLLFNFSRHASQWLKDEMKECSFEHVTNKCLLLAKSAPFFIFMKLITIRHNSNYNINNKSMIIRI